jgi:magnesium transporter
LKREIVVVIPVLVAGSSGREVDHLTLVCSENLLFTYHEKNVLSAEALASLDESESWLPDSSIAGLVASLMIDQSQACLQGAIQTRRLVRDLEERMDRDPDSVDAEEITDLRCEVLAIGTVVGDQAPCVQALSATDKSFFRQADAREFLSCALANLQAADSSLTWLDQRVGVLRSGFQMHAQEKTNRRLGMLTILSAIFMPITLLAGIWGMNFESMPELGFAFGYPLALALMALIGSGMYLYFRRAGWF